MPIQDNGEEFIDLISQDELSYGSSPEIPNNTDYTKMRVSVYEKLCLAQNTLPTGIKFRIYEAYRSLSLQQKLFSERKDQLSLLYPEWNDEKLHKEVCKMVSPVLNFDGTKNTPPHSTGGAIDVYLINSGGSLIDMGIYPGDWMQDNDGSISLTHSPAISEEVQANRKIMSEALEKAGFVNYPGEYWHWSYGDKYWAYHKNLPNAVYDSI